VIGVHGGVIEMLKVSTAPTEASRGFGPNSQGGIGMIWNVLPYVRDFSFDPARGPSVAVRTVASLDTALAESAAEPLTFQVRGVEVTLDEFRRLASDEPDAAPGDFVAFGANRERRIASF
jgi:hypothetical protein